MIIVDHLMYMHKELYSDLRKHNINEINQNGPTQYELMKQFQSLTQSLKEIALSFSPKDDQIINVN